MRLDGAGSGISGNSAAAELAEAPGPAFLCATGAEAQALAPALERAPALEIPRPGLSERAELWALLAPHGLRLPADEAGSLAARFRFGPAKIQRTARLATRQASLRPGAAPVAADLADAAR